MLVQSLRGARPSVGASVLATGPANARGASLPAKVGAGAVARPMAHAEFLLLDRRAFSRSIDSIRYSEHHFETTPASYAAETGIYIRLYGRTADGRSVVCEVALPAGFEVSLILDDDMSSDAAVEALVTRASSRMSKAHAATLRESLDYDECMQPRFYGFEPSDEGLNAREERVLSIRTTSLRNYRALNRVAVTALEDCPIHGM